ncbi:GPI-anchored small secreted protein [Suillus paluster]|uniref:GPI-anchored small secreted protein n=1 Tax=Suillus paluster TaxID=48578 RepID=UPI001B88689C|nr:GPI-anchored small secreted protein [Suillus paluster]KAG1745899.1 GPI-anchored small secreted protein [Suillus paluster]
MRSFTAILLATITSTFAYQIISPGGSQGWTTAGPNSLTWVRAATDPLNFTVMLINQNQTALPQGSEILDTYINGTLGQTVCSTPSGGWPQGYAFQVSLVDAEDINTVLTQSDTFNITASIASGGFSTISGTSSTSQVTTSASSTSSSTSTTSTTPTSINAAVVGMNVETGFLTAIAAMAAFIISHF